MGITAGWTAAHTGLPSFDVTGPCTVTSGGRVVSVVGDERRLFSDAGAAPGPNVYRDGETSVTVDRVVGVAWDAIFTDSRGRGIPGLIYENNNDPVSWKPNVDQFNRRIARWDLEIPPETGAGNLFLTDPSLEADVWRICKLGVHMFLGPAQPVPGVPMRSIVISDVGRSRIGVAGEIRFEIAWSEFIPASYSAPVVTWGEYAAHSDGWTHESYLDLCRRIGGMP